MEKFMKAVIEDDYVEAKNIMFASISSAFKEHPEVVKYGEELNKYNAINSTLQDFKGSWISPAAGI